MFLMIFRLLPTASDSFRLASDSSQGPRSLIKTGRCDKKPLNFLRLFPTASDSGKSP